jgi:hypothetical protein
MPAGVYPRTKEHCENISKARKGCKQPPNCGFQPGHSPSNTGRTRFKKGNSCNIGRIRLDMRGENNPNWVGGVTPEDAAARASFRYKEWKLAVYNRDGGICKQCGEKSTKGNIVAHHIKDFNLFPELRFEVTNGISLCRSCHVRIHKLTPHD